MHFAYSSPLSFNFYSIVIHLKPEGIANRSSASNILLLDSAHVVLDLEGVFIHPNHDEECSSSGFSWSLEVGLDGADSNSSAFSCCISSNFVKVTNTLTVDTTGMAT